jgi:hypothetical protein
VRQLRATHTQEMDKIRKEIEQLRVQNKRLVEELDEETHALVGHDTEEHQEHIKEFLKINKEAMMHSHNSDGVSLFKAVPVPPAPKVVVQPAAVEEEEVAAEPDDLSAAAVEKVEKSDTKAKETADAKDAPVPIPIPASIAMNDPAFKAPAKAAAVDGDRAAEAAATAKDAKSGANGAVAAAKDAKNSQ